MHIAINEKTTMDQSIRSAPYTPKAIKNSEILTDDDKAVWWALSIWIQKHGRMTKKSARDKTLAWGLAERTGLQPIDCIESVMQLVETNTHPEFWPGSISNNDRLALIEKIQLARESLLPKKADQG